ncbi:metallophosphoesterase, partial [Enterococcus hirae]|nr:metallophosphoesterase [Enterococcus hirae]
SAFTTGDSSTNPRRWSTLAKFKEMAKQCDVTVYGGDNCDCNSGRTGEFKIGVRDFGRTHSMAIQKRFANFASVWKKDVIVCRGNHDTGKIPYAWIGHTPETCLNSADMHHLYNGTFGGRLFPDKGIAIYRIDTDDYSDALDSNGQYKEFSGHTKDGEIGKIGAEQLKDFGTFLTNLDRSYHVLLVGHIPLDDSATGVWNTAALRILIDGFKQGVSVTIDYDSLTGEPSESVTGSEVFDFSTKGPGVIIAYICGHEHWETVRNLGTLKMIVGTCAFTKDTSVDFEAFYQLSIDKTARTLIMNGVGRATKRSFSY